MRRVWRHKAHAHVIPATPLFPRTGAVHNPHPGREKAERITLVGQTNRPDLHLDPGVDPDLCPSAVEARLSGCPIKTTSDIPS